MLPKKQGKHSEKSYRKNRWATPKNATEKIGGSGGLRERNWRGGSRGAEPDCQSVRDLLTFWQCGGQ